MPEWKAHLAFGAIATYVIFYLAKLPFDLPVLAIALFAAVLPDIDAQQSKINNIIELLLAGIAGFALVKVYLSNDLQFVVAGLIAIAVFITMQFMKHRGQMHNGRTAVILAIPFYFLKPEYAFAFAIGFISHLIADKAR